MFVVFNTFHLCGVLMLYFFSVVLKTRKSHPFFFFLELHKLVGFKGDEQGRSSESLEIFPLITFVVFPLLEGVCTGEIYLKDNNFISSCYF